jgi:hypothetical protein
MPAVHFHQTTSLTPEQYVAVLTDFGPDRSKVFGNSADKYLKVHHWDRTEADVTEGSGRILNTSSSRRQTPTCGEAPPATPTPSRVVPTAPPT